MSRDIALLPSGLSVTLWSMSAEQEIAKGRGGGELGRLMEEGSTCGGIYPKHIVVNILLIVSIS